MRANREIKIYGTLLNATVNAIIGDAEHNDALAYAYQLYDDKFGEAVSVDNFQDIINKRVTAIQYADGVTTIKNRDGVADGVPYMFVVEGASHLNGNNTITGNSDITGNTNIGGDLAVTGNETIGGTLTVDGFATLNDGAIITNGNLTVQRGDFFVQTGNASIAQDLNVGDDLTVGDKAEVGGTLAVTGPTTMSSLYTSESVFVGGNETIQGDLTVNGHTNLKNVTTDNINCKTLEASNGLIVTGNATINNGDLTVNNGDFGVTGDATVSGHLTVSDGANITGNTVLAGPLDVTGAANFRSPVNINSNLTVNGTGAFTGDVTAPNITRLRSDVDLLNASEQTPGSVRNTTAHYIAQVVASAPEDFDTLSEIAAWITANGKDAAGMNTRINENANNIAELANGMAHLSADVENHEKRITQLESDLQAQDNRLSTIEHWADLVDLDELPILRDEVAALRTRVANAETAISNNAAAITNLSGALSQLASRVGALESAQYWAVDGSTVYAKDGRSVRGAGFYDSTV